MGLDGKHRPLVGPGRAARRLVRAAGAALALWLPMAAAAAAQVPCRLALVLALDVSSSVDAAEYALQRDGLAAALSAPEVVGAIEAAGPIALTAFEWSGRYQQARILDWAMLHTPEEVAAAARRIGGARRIDDSYPTALGYALGHGAMVLQRGPACARRVIDLSGDGVTNDGFGPEEAYRHFPFEGVTVNGLAVTGHDRRRDPALLEFYRERVRRGPGAFVEVADGYEDFTRAMTRKLLREIGVPLLGEGRRPGMRWPGAPRAGQGALPPAAARRPG